MGGGRHMCVKVHIHMHKCVSVCRGQRSISDVIPWEPPTLLWETGLSHWPGSHWVVCTGCPPGWQAPSVLTSLRWISKLVTQCPWALGIQLEFQCLCDWAISIASVVMFWKLFLLSFSLKIREILLIFLCSPNLLRTVEANNYHVIAMLLLYSTPSVALILISFLQEETGATVLASDMLTLPVFFVPWPSLRPVPCPTLSRTARTIRFANTHMDSSKRGRQHPRSWLKVQTGTRPPVFDPHLTLTMLSLCFGWDRLGSALQRQLWYSWEVNSIWQPADKVPLKFPVSLK